MTPSSDSSRSMTHARAQTHTAQQNISFAFFLNAAFVVIEVAGGLWTNSIAILSDALHDFGDCLSLAVAWALQKKSQQKRDARYTYGYKRFSLLGSAFLSGVLSLSSLFVCVEAFRRIASPQPVNAEGMLWLAVVGVVINATAALRLKKHGHSLSERAVFLHMMEDVLGWIALLVVSLVMLFADLPVLDPLLSIGISIWVLKNVYYNLRALFRIFLQASPEGIDLDALHRDICALEGIDSIHDLHLWTLDGESHVLSLHVVSSANDPTAIKQTILQLAPAYHIGHLTIEMESPAHACLHNCESLQPCATSMQNS